MSLGVGFVGTGWMARAHTHALRAIGDLGAALPAARLVTLAGRDDARTEATARRLGFAGHTTDWRELVADPRVDIVVDVAANALHAAPSEAALRAGKHVVCEKPLAPTVEEAERMAAAVGPDTVAVCSYNYRFVPALRLARELIRDGRLGTLRHMRACYLQDWAGDQADRHGWRFEDAGAGSSVADYSHVIDLVRWLAGEPVEVCGLVGTLDGDALRPAGISVDHEDWYAALARTGSGVMVTLEASRVATGWKGRQYLEIVGSRGTVSWDMEELNRLRVYLRDGEGDVAGFRDVLVTEPGHPFLRHWWAPGHTLGWEHTLVHEWIAVLAAIAGSADRVTDLPTFADGLRACRIVAAVRASAADGTWRRIDDERA